MTDKKVDIKWEGVSSDHSAYISRTRTPWGWLVLIADDVLHNFPDGRILERGYEWRNNITFVFDPFHRWK